MKPGTDAWRDLVGRISDGEDVDWDAMVRRSPRIEDEARPLRELAEIAAFHRMIQRSSEAEGPSAESITLESWGKLLLLEPIGRGTHAEVHRAWDLELRREVALKLLHEPAVEGARDGRVEQSPLLGEARALAQIRHPNVVVVHGIAEHAGRVGVWMELIRGVSLAQLVDRKGALDLASVERLVAEIGSALAAVHAAGLLHRDVKPANVVRDDAGRWVLTDFGLGSRRERAAREGALRSGTPMYMAPELLRGAAPSERSEVYAFGLLVWTALAGRHPFDASQWDELVEACAHGPSVAIDALRDDLPPAFVASLRAAIDPEPARRPASIEACAQDLLGSLAGAAVGAPGPATDGDRTPAPHLPAPAGSVRRSGSRAVGVVALVVLCVLVFFALGRERASQPEHMAQVPPAAGVVPGGEGALASYDVEASLQRLRDGVREPLVDGDAVRPGDDLVLEVRASVDAWVYVLNEDDRGERYLLFPQPSIFDRTNPLAEGASYELPGTSQGRRVAWTVTSAGGREHFLVVVSPRPVDELELDLASLPAPRPGEPVRYAPISEQAVERLRGVGGVRVVDARPSEPAPSPTQDAFDRFRELAGRETGVRGVWVRHVTVHNRG